MQPQQASTTEASAGPRQAFDVSLVAVAMPLQSTRVAEAPFDNPEAFATTGLY